MSNPAIAYRTTREVVAENLAAELARARKTGREAARELGLKQMYVARRIAGEVELSVSDLVAFADYLSVPVTTLLDDTKKAPTPRGEGLLLPEMDSNHQPAG